LLAIARWGGTLGPFFFVKSRTRIILVIDNN
jgi:hypothetical protein